MGTPRSETDELMFHWLRPERAARAALAKHPIMEALRNSHGLLDLDLFASALACGDMEIVGLPAECAALIEWGESEHGKTMNILTVYCKNTQDAEQALTTLEAAARQNDARAIVSVGHPLWKKIVKQHGYQVKSCILMKKVLQ